MGGEPFPEQFFRAFPPGALPAALALTFLVVLAIPDARLKELVGQIVIMMVVALPAVAAELAKDVLPFVAGVVCGLFGIVLLALLITGVLYLIFGQDG